MACASALGAHSAIGLFGGAYDAHEHIAVGPVAGLALAVFGALVLRIAAASLVRATPGTDAIALLARQFAAVAPARGVAAVTAGAFVVLGTMETVEQLVADGRVSQIGDSLGAIPWLGAAILAAFAVVSTLAARAVARSLVVAVARSTRALVSFIALVIDAIARAALAAVATRLARRPRRCARAVSAATVGRRSPRAPPSALTIE